MHGESRRQSGGISTRDGVFQGRDERQSKEAAITRTYDTLPGVNDDMLSPAVINATKAMSCDAVAPYRVANLKIEVGAKVIEWVNSSDGAPDRKQISHYHKNETDVGYSEEHGHSTVVTARLIRWGSTAIMRIIIH